MVFSNKKANKKALHFFRGRGNIGAAGRGSSSCHLAANSVPHDQENSA